MSKHLFFLDAGKEGFHVSQLNDGSISIQTTDKAGQFQSGVTIPPELITEFAGRFVGSVISPRVIKGETYLRRTSIMASNQQLPGLGESVTYVTQKGTKVAAIVSEAPARPGLDNGIIPGLFVLDPTGTYFRKDVEYRDEVGGWQWKDVDVQVAVDAMAASDKAIEEASNTGETNPESAATGTTSTRKATAKKGSKK